MRFTVLSFAAVVVSGCAEMEWHKDGTDPAMLSRDLDECRQVARMQAKRQTFPPGYDAPRIVGVDSQNRAIVTTPGRAETDRYVIEQDLTRQCMSSLGYELTPARKP
jgi:hypothetical protein